MTQEPDVDALVRQRIRSLREARGCSLDALAARCFLSPSTLSRIETGHRRIALDQLVPIAQALETSLDALIESGDDADVVIRPQADSEAGRTMWILSRGGASGSGPFVAKMRMTPTRPVPVDQLGVHPGRDWFTVLSGTARLQLGERTILVEAGDAAEFSTMVPHAIGAHRGVAEILTILDRDGQRAHLRTTGVAPAAHEAHPGDDPTEG